MKSMRRNRNIWGLSLFWAASAVVGCESGEDDSTAVQQPSSFYELCDDTCGGGYACINGVCTLPCEVESECDSTPFDSTCRTRFGIGSCEAWCEDNIGASEKLGCDPFGEGFACWTSTCHPKDWVGPPEVVGPPGIDSGVNSTEWGSLAEGAEFSCTLGYSPPLLCELIEVYEAEAEDEVGCRLPGRLDFALRSDQEAFAFYLEWNSNFGPEPLCQDLDCFNLKGCVIERLTFEDGGEPCMTDASDSTYFEPGYCVLQRGDPNVNSELKRQCVDVTYGTAPSGMGGAHDNIIERPVVRVVGEGLPRPGGRLIYMCGQDLAAMD